MRSPSSETGGWCPFCAAYAVANNPAAMTFIETDPTSASRTSMQRFVTR
jgi:hypothetical protein